MFKAYRINTTVCPSKFESLNNGISYYNYDITKTLNEEQSIYSFVQVRVTEPVTIDKCIDLILKAYINENGTSLYNIGPFKDSESETLINEIYTNIKVDFGLELPLSDLDKAKKDKIKEIEKYDISLDVNSFFLNGLQVWLNKDTRVGLMNSLTIEKNSGKETSTLWFGNIKLNINTDSAILMLSSLELYALECYNKTAEHKVNIEELESVDEILNYDYTLGYPDKLNFNI